MIPVLCRLGAMNPFISCLVLVRTYSMECIKYTILIYYNMDVTTKHGINMISLILELIKLVQKLYTNH